MTISTTAYFPSKSNVTDTTKHTLMNMLRKASLDMGAHHGINSEGTLMLKIRIKKSITTAKANIVTALIKYLKRAICKENSFSYVAIMFLTIKSKTGM